jgi:predicted nucleic acid-binding protein
MSFAVCTDFGRRALYGCPGSRWDAAILEAARSLGCDVVLSEDLSAGQDYAGVRVEDPFAGG